MTPDAVPTAAMNRTVVSFGRSISVCDMKLFRAAYYSLLHSGMHRGGRKASTTETQGHSLMLQAVFRAVSLRLIARGGLQLPRRPSRTKRPASPPPEVTLTTGEPERRTIAPATRPRKRKGFVSAYSGWKPHAVSVKTGKSSV